MTHWKCFQFLGTLAFHGAQLGNYDLKIIQVPLDIGNTPCSIKFVNFICNYICILLSKFSNVFLTKSLNIASICSTFSFEIAVNMKMVKITI